MLSIVALFAVAASAGSALGTCNGDTYPDPSDCAKIIKSYPDEPGYFDVPAKGDGCRFLNPPSGVSPDSLNCRICVATRTSDTKVVYGDIDIAYDTVKEACFPAKAGGQSYYETAQVTVSNNPSYNGNPAGSKRDIERRRSYPPALAARSETCANGHGNLELLLMDKNVAAPKAQWKEITRLANGDEFMYQKSDSKTVGVDISVSVEASFFDLFSTTFSTTLSQSYTVQSTEGQTVTNNCPDGKEAIVYLQPIVDVWYTECKQTKKTINVYKPGSIQNTYTYECLG